MTKWSDATVSHGYIRLKNKTRTVLKINSRAQFDVWDVLERLDRAKFPLSMVDGIPAINFTYLKRMYGDYDYQTKVVRVDVRKSHRAATLAETIVHEVAHHLDRDDEIAEKLTGERKRQGRFIHRRARESDDEYFARGFERFYSGDPQKRVRLRSHKRLYRAILSLDRKHKKL